MNYQSKFWTRRDNVFFNTNQSFDLGSISFLHTGVDTVKQLFNCLLKLDVISQIQQHQEINPGRSIFLGEIDWQVTRSSKQSGYQYILKNLDEGFVVMLKSFYADACLNASHVKIEVTPQCIYDHTPDQLTARLKSIAGIFATQLIECGIAAHMAVDIKGLQIPADFEQRLVAKAKRQFRVNNISNAQVSLNETSVVYGNGQTYTFGSASSLQFCLYEKDEEAKKSDKIGFWEGVWSKVPSADDFMTPEYSPGDRVHRLEMRFHHSIIREFCNASVNEVTGEVLQINNFSDLSNHLTALWRYSLNNFRLQHSTTYIDPLWQLLIEDITIFPPAPDWMYKRGKKPPSQSTRRNVAFWLGNVLKIMARKRFTVAHACQWIMQSGCNEELADYFGVFQFGADDELRYLLQQFVKEKFETHILSGVAA